MFTTASHIYHTPSLPCWNSFLTLMNMWLYQFRTYNELSTRIVSEFIGAETPTSLQYKELSTNKVSSFSWFTRVMSHIPLAYKELSFKTVSSFPRSDTLLDSWLGMVTYVYEPLVVLLLPMLMFPLFGVSEYSFDNACTEVGRILSRRASRPRGSFDVEYSDFFFVFLLRNESTL